MQAEIKMVLFSYYANIVCEMEGIAMLAMIIAAIEDDYEREFIIKIHDDYYVEMKKRAFRFLRNNDEAEELVQDAFVKLIERVDVVMKVDKNKLPGYVMSTVKNLALNKIRVNQRKGDYEFSRDDAELAKWLKDNQDLPEDLYQKEEELYLIHKKLSELPERDNLLLEAKYILQLKDEEIAKQFNISQQSVRTYIMRARRKAYALFKEDMENE